ncbi:Tn7-like element transposition protein TnsE [Clostridium cagae]|uniref:Tn7-like element transposition protein TnsE n=1 Tax=Clostridium cagae TaxID=2080751 RepID=UPI0013F71609|nr:hypothetical protein [Clostridium botulinum]NFO53567.1 hypothetical protein [Clostridium botulinum]
MGKQKLKLKNWPFEKGEKAQLIWIGEPFKENNKWMIDTYFSDGKNTKKVIQDWANIHFLSIDKYYCDGDLRSGEIIDIAGVMSTIDINLCGIIPKYNEGDWNISKSNYKSKSKTFNFWKNNVLYTVPIVEIVRAVLAPNTFMLNTILYNDVWEDYFTYDIQDRMLQIAFSNEYKTSYLKSEYYNHLAWMISNDEILKMCNEIGYSMLSKRKLLFDFNVPNFSINARVKKNKHGFTIMEILKVNLKEIKVDELKVYHPSFEDHVKSNEAKLRTYTYLINKGEDRIIDNSVDGAKDVDESINNELIVQEYIKAPIIKKEKERNGKLRTTEDNDTKKYIIHDDNLRTLSLEGGMKKTNGIEVSAIDETIIPLEFNSFINVLEIIKNNENIELLEYYIVNLPLGSKFSCLNYSVQRRKGIIARIMKYNKKEYILLEVERENRKLSTLLLDNNSNIKWRKICEEILIGLVKESGSWKNEILDYLKGKGVHNKRLKHVSKTNNKVAEYILKKLD